MYSLDQVIYFLEQRQQTEDWNIRDAAIAYLKGYREVLPEYAQMKLDAVKNDPMTWDELKWMEGRPVWAEDAFDNGEWYIIECFTESGRFIAHDRWADDTIFKEKDMGDVWQAYRKERE